MLTCGAHELCTCDWSAGAHGVTTMLGGVTVGQAPHNSSNVRCVTAGNVRHNCSMYKERKEAWWNEKYRQIEELERKHKPEEMHAKVKRCRIGNLTEERDTRFE